MTPDQVKVLNVLKSSDIGLTEEEFKSRCETAGVQEDPLTILQGLIIRGYARIDQSNGNGRPSRIKAKPKAWDVILA